MIESATELAGQMTKKVEASTTSNGTTACHKDTSIDGIPSLNTDEFALLSRLSISVRLDTEWLKEFSTLYLAS